MFSIQTDHPFEQSQLDQDHFQTQYNQFQFHINIREASAIMSFVDSTAYQVYHQKSSKLAQDVIKFANNTLNLNMSLNLFIKCQSHGLPDPRIFYNSLA